jgi:hypothetical protein
MTVDTDTQPARALALTGAALWRGAPGPAGEGSNARKRAVVQSTPKRIVDRAHMLGTSTPTRKRLVVDWLEALTVEQMFAERIVRDGIRYDAWADAGAAKCSPMSGRHVWSGVEISLRRGLVSLPGGWQPLEIRCTACRCQVESVFLVERDTERGEWMRITSAIPVPVQVAFHGLSRHTLGPLETLVIEHVDHTCADPITFPSKVRRVYPWAPTRNALSMLGEVAHVIEPSTEPAE